MDAYNIVFLSNSLGFGGAEKVLNFVAGQLAERGYNCSILNFNNVPSYVNSHTQTINNLVHVKNVQYPKNNCNKRLYQIKETINFGRERHADVFVAFTAMPSFVGKIAGLLLGVPAIMSERGDPSKTIGSNIVKHKLVNFVINSSDGGVFQTVGAMEYFSKKLQRRGTVIPNPIFIDNSVFALKGNREKTVVSVGRLDNEQKRYDVMIKAFASFHLLYPEYTLKIYGTGSDQKNIVQWIVESNLQDCVFLMGVSKKPIFDIINDGIFVISSDYEGISNSLLEAMAIGLPCVSTDHTPGGARMLIKDHYNGLLVPVGDYKKLASALCEFAGNSELAESCGLEAQKVTERFSPERIINQWEAYIDRIIKNRK